MIAAVGTSGALVVGLIALSSVSMAGDGVAPGAFKPVASVGGLMSGQGMTFKRLRKAVANPKTHHRYGVIRAMSQVLAELSNVNQYNNDKADYQGWARSLRDTALQLSAEARKGAKADDETMKKLVRSMKSTCGACHDVYQDEDDDD